MSVVLAHNHFIFFSADVTSDIVNKFCIFGPWLTSHNPLVGQKPPVEKPCSDYSSNQQKSINKEIGFKCSETVYAFGNFLTDRIIQSVIAMCQLGAQICKLGRQRPSGWTWLL